jgi:hypothetical protein
VKTQEKKLKLAPVKTQEKTLNSGKDAEVGTLKRLLSQKNSYKECRFIELLSPSRRRWRAHSTLCFA